MSDDPDWETFRTNYAMDYIHSRVSGKPEDYIPKVREFDRVIAEHDAELRKSIAADPEVQERLARAFFARSQEGRNGFSWPLNGDRDRARDLENAGRVLHRILGVDAARIAKGEA